MTEEQAVYYGHLSSKLLNTATAAKRRSTTWKIPENDDMALEASDRLIDII